jgi:hypothetical protein
LKLNDINSNTIQTGGYNELDVGLIVDHNEFIRIIIDIINNFHFFAIYDTEKNIVIFDKLVYPSTVYCKIIFCNEPK